MNILNRFLGLVFLCPLALNAQIRLTELAPSNTGYLSDEDGDHPDWIELQNGSAQAIDLAGWALSDGSFQNSWQLPDIQLAAGERLLVFASGKNRGGLNQPQAVDHWESAIYDNDAWRYFIGDSQPPADWNVTSFDAAVWSLGPGGFGYGDGDDATTVPNGTITVYYRRSFTVQDPAKLTKAVLSIDYDDGFVAYLNGHEIARSTNLQGAVDYTTLAVPDREATGTPENYDIGSPVLAAFLQPGENVLAVEIHNTAVSSSDMTGRSWLHFGISTDEQFYGPTPSWFFPGGGTLGGLLHTDFKLNPLETLRLFNPAGQTIDSLLIGNVQPGHARMRLNDDGDWCLTDIPTPGAANGWDCFSGYAETPVFDLPAGFYAGSKIVGLTGAGTIRYTTDGSIPGNNSPVFAGAVPVTVNTVLRARAFESGKLPSYVATSSYFIGENVSLPVVSVCIPPSDFGAIYDNFNAKGAVSVEYFDKGHQRQFSGDFAGYVVGNWSVTFPQKSLQFDADEEYGSLGEINYPIFDDKPISKYHSFRIRNEDDDWTLARMRDRIVNELAAPTHSGRAAYRNVIAFINGAYWGHYVARERLDNYFVRDNYGADPDSVSMAKTHYGVGDYVAEYGDINDFFAMSDFISGNDMNVPANFERAAQLLDLENFTDYLATEIFVASTDWLQDYFNNIRLFKTKRNAPWKFLLWDVSYSSGAGSGCSSCDVLNSTLNHSSRYGQIWRSLLARPEYRRYFINRFADLMNTAFLTSRAHDLIDANAAELGPEIDRHNERWGTGDFAAWSDAVVRLKQFYAERPGNQRQQIIDNFDLDKVVSITLKADPPLAGTIKISTIVPATLPWTGLYFHGNPVTVTAIANPGYTFSHWESNPLIANAGGAVFTADVDQNTEFIAHFTGSAQAANLSVSEINYHSSPDLDAGDWFELHNQGNVTLDVSDFLVKDKEWYHNYRIPTGTQIPAQGYLVLSTNPQKFQQTFTGVQNVATQPLNFELDKKQDQIRVMSRSGAPMAQASYEDAAPWPQLADGWGLTLERMQGAQDPHLPQSWFNGCVGGSPGAGFSECPEWGYLSEINYHAAPTADAGDWLELRNPGGTDLDLSGWELRDGNDDHRYILPSGTTIPAQNPHWVLFQDATKFTGRFPGIVQKSGPFTFGLGNEGDLIRLFKPDGKLFLCMEYSDKAPWAAEADGLGYTLEKPDTHSDLLRADSWIKGCPEGSPAAAFDPDCSGSVGMQEPGRTGWMLSIRPNPATDKVWVEASGPLSDPLYLVDVLGRPVISTSLEHGTASLEVGGLPAGCYYLVARTQDGGEVRKKLIVQPRQGR